MKGAVFVWVRNVPETITWLLCSKRLPINKDIAKYMTKYLFDQKFLFDPDSGITWMPQQLKAFQSIHEHDCTIVNVPTQGETIMCVAGIVASYLLRSKDYDIAVYRNDKMSRTKIMKAVVAMIAGRREVLCENTRCIRIKDCNNSVEILPYTDRSMKVSSLIICIDTDKIEPRFFFKHLIPIVSVAGTRVLCFGDLQAGHWLYRLSEMRRDNGDPFFNVIRE